MTPDLPADMRAFLEELGLLRRGEPTPPAEPLTGGVSSEIWRVDFPGRPLCIKRALATLKVKADWQAPVERSRYEYAWLAQVAAILPEAVPPLIGQRRDGGMFATAYFDPQSAPLWKGLLLQGQVDPAFAGAVGRSLGTIHAATAGDPQMALAFASDVIFHAIRLAPYLLVTAERHPGLAGKLRGLVETTAASRLALVHGDVSPKNILVRPQGPVFLDAECAWYGDPAFDLAFCLNHLLLKQLAVPPAQERLRQSAEAMVAAYLPTIAWEDPAALERRCAALLPGLALARVDGKSPVEYLTEEGDRETVRRFAIPLLRRSVGTLGEVMERWRQALS